MYKDHKSDSNNYERHEYDIERRNCRPKVSATLSVNRNWAFQEIHM